jgi:hypothetical protein
MGGIRNAYEILVEKPEEKYVPEKLGEEGKMRLKWISEK